MQSGHKAKITGFFIVCFPIPKFCNFRPNFAYFGRDLATEHFYYKVVGVEILVWDVISGSLKYVKLYNVY